MSRPARRPGEFAWLGSARQIVYPLNRLNPIWVKENVLADDLPLPSATVQVPEHHPYCEISLNLGGSGVQHIGAESCPVEPQSVMLLGPGIPHTAQARVRPGRSITVYVLPALFFDLGPQRDGAAILRRFTAEQPIERRVYRLNPARYRLARTIMLKMRTTFGQQAFGRELRLRSLLAELVTSLLRWEAVDQPDGANLAELPANWEQIQTALRYLHEHHAEIIYMRQLAAAVRLGERQLNRLFRERLGMGCMEYLNSYRVSQAAAQLSAAHVPVTTVAFSVGFETLSHFNTTFRRVMGVSPTAYLKRKSSGQDVAA